MRWTLGLLGFLICLRVTAVSVAAPIAETGEQDFAKGEALLKNKQYVEARAALEAGMVKNSSNVQAHLNLAEACRGLAAWACAEEHYETALHLDAKSRTVGTREVRLRKMKVWQSLEEATAWRLLEEARSLIADAEAHPDQIKKAEEALDGANELGLNQEQQAVYQQLETKLPGRRATTLLDSLKPAETPMVLVPGGGVHHGEHYEPRRNAGASRLPQRLQYGQVPRDGGAVCQVSRGDGQGGAPGMGYHEPTPASETPRCQCQLV